VCLDTRTEKITNIYHEQDFGLSAHCHFYAKSHEKGPADGMGRTVKMMIAKESLQKAYNN
jgi:hypothetical protein